VPIATKQFAGNRDEMRLSDLRPTVDRQLSPKYATKATHRDRPIPAWIVPAGGIGWGEFPCNSFRAGM
jgi:hypothetical protein